MYLGSYWDLCQRQIEIPEKKTTTYLKAIEEWEAREMGGKGTTRP